MNYTRTRWLLLITAFALTSENSSAFEIQIDYSLDTNGFFESPESRAALRAVCDFYESIISDELAAIEPETWDTGDNWTAFRINPATRGLEVIENLTIPENTYLLYAGGTALGNTSGEGAPGTVQNAGGGPPQTQAEFDRNVELLTLVTGRGQEGADFFANPATDFAPWGGTVTFDTGRTWNFSTSGADDTEDLEFIPVALHEIGHALGMGTSASWRRYVSGTIFTGPHSTEAHGENVPLADAFHWADDVRSPSLEGFGIPDGVEAIPILNRFSPPANAREFRGLSQLDLAGLADIGWEVTAPVPEPAPPAPPVVRVEGNQIFFAFTTVPGKNYTIQRNTSLTADWDDQTQFEGDGTAKEWNDPDPTPEKGFYRLIIEDKVESSP